MRNTAKLHVYLNVVCPICGNEHNALNDVENGAAMEYLVTHQTLWAKDIIGLETTCPMCDTRFLVDEWEQYTQFK